MLKIKDSVDLKELEKFGLTTFAKDGYTFIPDEKIPYMGIKIFNEDRSICVNTTKAIEVLFDLIQAGLVEKVGD